MPNLLLWSQHLTYKEWVSELLLQQGHHRKCSLVQMKLLRSEACFLILSYFWHWHNPQHTKGGSAHCSSTVPCYSCPRTSFLALLPNKFLLLELLGSSCVQHQCQHHRPGTSTTMIPNSKSVWQWLAASVTVPVPPWAVHPHWVPAGPAAPLSQAKHWHTAGLCTWAEAQWPCCASPGVTRSGCTQVPRTEWDKKKQVWYFHISQAAVN